MGEFDFDELDKAVNDLMTNVDTSKRTDGADDPADKVITIPTSGTESPAVVPATTAVPQVPTADSPENSVAVNTKESSAPSLATKRRGQFMDIVHPSLNMKNSPKFANQHGTTIRPSVNAENHVAEGVKESLDISPTEHIEAGSGGSAQQSDWPDPIDMANESAAAQHDNPDPTIVSDLEATSAGPSVSYSPEPAPLTSPFLSDTKVEKRPLGNSAPSLDTRSDPSSTGIDANTEAEAKAQVTTTPPVILPAELSGDIMAVESKDLSTHSGQSPAIATQPAPRPSSETAVLSSKGSIAQQYTEQPSTGDQTSGSMYDTSTYHQAIDTEKPVKKSSPLKLIIWIVVLLLVGAAAGAAYFYFTR